MKVSAVITTYNRKNDVLRCVESVLASDFADLETIVVDNASQDGTAQALRERFGSAITVAEPGANLNAAGGRNFGARAASGEFIVFIDSDNVVDRRLVSALADVLASRPDCGMAGCVMCYFSDKRKIWCAGADIDMLSSRTHYRNAGRDISSVTEAEPYEVGHLPNLFMVRKRDFDELGGFYEPYGIMFEESDLAERIRRSGKKILVVPSALDCHDQPILSGDSLRAWGLHTVSRAYVIARNRNLFMRRNAGFVGKLVYFTLFLPLFTAYYVRIAVRHRAWHIARAYMRGAFGFGPPAEPAARETENKTLQS